MKAGESREKRGHLCMVATGFRWSLAKAGDCYPKVVAGLSCLGRRVPWRMLMLVVGLVVQAILIVLVWQLVDLSVALMEVWLELARKHLEIVLSA